MQKQKKKLHAKKTGYAGLLLAALFILSGCTKKELLLLDEEEAFFETEEAAQTAAAEEVTPTGTEPETMAQTGPAEETAPAVRTEPDVICVHVCGAVQLPGVYELRAGSRVYEAVQAAGGFAEEADQSYVNQAQELADGVKLVIPTLEETEEVLDRERAAEGQDVGENENSDGKSGSARIGIVTDTFFAETENAGQDQDKNAKININTASEAQLCDIPGIGATRAAAIAAYREAHGEFRKPEDIMKVNGIKEGMYEKIKDSICVN